MPCPRPILLAASLIVTTALGCASRDQKPLVDADGYQPSAAAALVYEPPAVTMLSVNERMDLEAELARFGRGESSVLGYDTPTVSSYTLYVDDRQILYGGRGSGYGFGSYGGFGFGYGGGFYDRYERRATVVEGFDRVRP